MAQAHGNLKPNHCPKPKEYLSCSQMSHVNDFEETKSSDEGESHSWICWGREQLWEVTCEWAGEFKVTKTQSSK